MPSKIEKLGILILLTCLITHNVLAFNPNNQQNQPQINLPQITTQSVYDILKLLTVNLIKTLQRLNTLGAGNTPLINPNQPSFKFPQIFNTSGGDLLNNLGGLVSSIFQAIFNLIQLFIGAVWTNAPKNR